MHPPSPVSDPTRPRADLPETSFAIEIPGVGAVAGRAWNPGGRAGTVGVVHGLGDHAGRYGRAVDALIARGFAVEAIDLPGHGRSYGPRGHVRSWNEYRGAIDSWWERPRDPAPRPVAVVGHSMGCLVAFDFALRHPERLRALVLSAPPFELVVRPEMLKVRLAQLIVRLRPSFSQRTPILPSMLSRDQDVVRAHNADPLVHYTMSARLFFEFTAAQAALRGAAPRLPIPALVLHGTRDPVSSPRGSERWVGAAPPGRADLRLYPGLLHEILNEPEGPRIAAEMAEWLEATLASGD
jgi:alpha-beta hydrolase superfamily lysophospholipase